MRTHDLVIPFFLLCFFHLFSTSTTQASSFYISGNYQIVEHRLGGNYGNFNGKGYGFTVGKRWSAFALEGMYGKNDAAESRNFYNQPYAITLEENYVSAGARIFLFKYFNFFAGMGKHNRVITVPPGCPFQGEFVLDDSCSGVYLGAGFLYPMMKGRADLFAQYLLESGCNQKRVVDLGIRVYF
ncbi:MAG: hypothetical protein HOE90_21095 [Bacteriovoracaceae bacterium]|jgi:hypothetical protein|nr:hypothetical protein [Bacteriovoracaceae bacterium]